MKTRESTTQNISHTATCLLCHNHSNQTPKYIEHCWEKIRRIQKRYFRVESYVRTHQCWPTNKSWYSLAVCGHMSRNNWKPSIYIYIFIYISSSSSCHAISTDTPDHLLPVLPIVHRFRQVPSATSRILTELLYVGSSWPPCFCTAMWMDP